MADNEISVKLFDKFSDFVRNYDSSVEIAEGVFWNRLTEAQRTFMINHLTTKIEWPVHLFSGQDTYQIPSWIMEIMELELRDSKDVKISPHFNSISYPQLVENLYVELPRTTTAQFRYMKVYPSDGTSITAGWRLMTKVFIRPLSTDVIDRQHAPIIESDYHDLLVDYVLSSYRTKIIDNKAIVNPNLRDARSVLNDVQLIRNRMYGLNATAILHPSSWFGG
jgi:hypothetical protein